MTCRQCAFYNPFQISTHTSHARCDDSLKRIDRFHCISTHTSRVGCDFMTGGIDVNRLTGFLLTHPVWDVTINTVYINKSKNQISTHTSRVGCDFVFCSFISATVISTHTSRVGCD